MKRWLTLAALVAGGTSWYMLVPDPPVVLSVGAGGDARPVRGAIHVHTRRSDGTGTVEDVAAAAQRAGLQFVIFTDHGDATRGSDTPVYRGGVLCIDAVEISTNDGHVVALGLPQSPFPLGGEVGDVIEDVQRLGGMSIAAHPDSTRPDLRWTKWDAPFDGLEWLNGDSQWRDESWSTLGRSLLTYPFSPVSTLAALLDRPDDLMKQWDTLLRSRSVVAVAGVDAHARIGPGRESSRRSVSLHVPSYEQSFRALSISLPDAQLHGNALDDARTVVEALRSGHLYSSVDGLAAPAVFGFTATSGAHRAQMGDRLPLDGIVALRAQAHAPAGSSIRLLMDGTTVASAPPPVLEFVAPPNPGVYRVEIDVAGSPGRPPVPWIVSNPIYVGLKPVAVSPAAPALVSESRAVYADGPANGWRIEKSVRSEGVIGNTKSISGTELLLRYGLGGTLSESPYVAAVVDAGSDLPRFDRVVFTGRAIKPMRLTIQLRAPDDGDRRWGRSVYLDETARTVTIALAELLPLGTATGSPPLGDVRDLLFVVDTVHSKQGASGQVWLDDIRYVR